MICRLTIGYILQQSYRKIVPLSARCPWFHNLSRVAIDQFTRLRFGHFRLPLYAYYLNLNDPPNCAWLTEDNFGDFQHVIFCYPALGYKRVALFRELFIIIVIFYNTLLMEFMFNIYIILNNQLPLQLIIFNILIRIKLNFSCSLSCYKKKKKHFIKDCTYFIFKIFLL